MIEVEVKNFQSIECATIQVKGFTALVGRSNIGKSAVVRAVKAALTGAPSTSFVRHAPACLRKIKGTKTCKCQCSVHLKGDAFDLLWEKGDAINRYTFNGAVFDKAERGTPEFLQPLYSPVKIGDDKELLQVSDQFDPIFLLNQTGGIVADVLSDVAHLDRVNNAIRMAEKDRKEAVSTRKVREQDVVTLTNRLVQYDGLDKALANTRDVEDRLDVVEAAEKKVALLDAFLERGTAIGQHIKSFEAIMQVEAPNPTPVSVLAETHRKTLRFCTQLTERESAVDWLQAIEGIVAPLSETLRGQLVSYETLTAWHGRLLVFKAALEALKKIEGIVAPTPETIRTQAEVYERLTGWYEKLLVFKAAREKEKVFKETRDFDSKGLVESSKAHEGLVRLANRHITLEEQVALLTTQYREIEAEGVSIQAEWDALGVCPTCTQPFHAGGHETQV